MDEKNIERFWSKVKRGSDDECWLWQGKPNIGGGYGYIRVAGRRWRAHRFSWFLKHGDPGERKVLHHCDTPLCVNPTCLFLGTDADNMRDRDQKNRQAQGEKHGSAKLTESAVREIRKLAGTISQRKIAKRFAISQVTVSDILLRRNWKYV